MKVHFIEDDYRTDLSGPFRTIHLSTGFFVTGCNYLIPCQTEKEANDRANEMRRWRESQGLSEDKEKSDRVI
jgi:hypothetical protein